MQPPPSGMLIKAYGVHAGCQETAIFIGARKPASRKNAKITKENQDVNCRKT
jgi:hypothetical protein